MPFTSSKAMILAAQEDGYAVPAFNAENMEMFQAVVEAAESSRSPVIIQTTPTTVSHIRLDMAVAMARTLAERATVQVALHLDHCEDFGGVMRAIRAGYTSVMYDGSKREFSENLGTSALVARMSAAMDLTSEAELGAIGGKEDSLEAAEAYADPDQVERFVAGTGVDTLAVAIGTAHGVYKGEPRLDFDRLREIRRRVRTPLVLHGASGLSADLVREAIALGMCKVNFATELRIAFSGAVRHALEDRGIFDPKSFLREGRRAVVETCREKIRMCGSENRC